MTINTPAAQQLIDGKLVGASDGATFPIINPATEEQIGVAPDGSTADMDAAIAAARRAFDETDWSTNLELRVRCLRQLHKALLDNAADFQALTVAEVGAPLMLMAAAHYDGPVEGVEWVADLAEGYEWEQDLGNAEPFGIPSHRIVRREPIGVVGAITPWNFPTQINLAKVAPALAAGNTVILKPAPDTPWVAAELGRLVVEHTDMPAGVFNVVTSADHQVGAMLSADPRIDLVSFTGSTATGKAVAAAAAPTLKKVFLELGGKSAAIVLDDADLALGVGSTAFQVCTHAGQGCAITTRLIVPRERYEEAVEIAAATVTHVPFGDPSEPSTFCGPIISAAQRDRVEGYLATVVDAGGRFAAGGGRPEGRDTGFWIEPTVIADVDNSSKVAQEEIFGPVLVVIAHDGDDDAVRIANDSPYGLSGAVFGGDHERAMNVARRIRTGTLSVNGGIYYSNDAPFGGYKQSGIGREMGVAGFEEYLEIKTIAEPA